MTKRILPDIIKRPALFSLPPGASVKQAADLMAAQSIGVVLVQDGGGLRGIFSERDVVARVVAEGLDPATTSLETVMSRDVVTIRPDSTATEALQLMRDFHCRHLPVMAGNQVVAMVSVRDLYQAVYEEMESDLEQRTAFIFSGGY